jgi:chemotaxis response regulator CheB
VSTLVPSRSGSASYVYDVVAVGASAGGLHSLGALIEAFPGSFRCPVLVVQHLSPEYKSIFAEILGRGAGLPVQQAVDREKMHPGVVCTWDRLRCTWWSRKVPYGCAPRRW